MVVAVGLVIFWMVRHQATTWRENSQKSGAGNWMTILSRESFGFDWLNRQVAGRTVQFASVLQKTQTGILSWNVVGILSAFLAILLYLVWSVK
jgi:hypothetical protein